MYLQDQLKEGKQKKFVSPLLKQDREGQTEKHMQLQKFWRYTRTQ